MSLANQINQIKSFIILTVIRRSVLQVGEAHLRIIAPGQLSLFRINVAAMASRLQHWCPIWPARDLNLRPPASETNALPLDQLASGKFLIFLILLQLSNGFIAYKQYC